MSGRFYQILFTFFITSITFAVMGAAYRHPEHSPFMTAGLLLAMFMIGLLSGAVTSVYKGWVFTCVLLGVLIITGVNNYAMIAAAYSAALLELVLGYTAGFLYGRYCVARLQSAAS